jgi:hypothetical protein
MTPMPTTTWQSSTTTGLSWTTCNEKSLALEPTAASAHFELSEALLLQGNFEKGWEEYEWRFQIPGAPRLLPPTDRPHWDGKAITNGTLLLVADQGYGDSIHFCRYIPWAARRCPNLVVACSSEVRAILNQQKGVVRTFDRWEERPEFAAYCPLSGLPRLHGTNLRRLPADIPYVRADPAKAAAWRRRLDTLLPAGYRRIGICWAGRPTHGNDRNRSITLQTLAPIAALEDISLVSLQKGPPLAQIGSYFGRAPLVNLDPEITTFEDTAAVIDALDLVICVDTSVGHLAGAMGAPVWVLLPYAPDWRWLLGPTTAPGTRRCASSSSRRHASGPPS